MGSEVPRYDKCPPEGMLPIRVPIPKLRVEQMRKVEQLFELTAPEKGEHELYVFDLGSWGREGDRAMGELVSQLQYFDPKRFEKVLFVRVGR